MTLAQANTIAQTAANVTSIATNSNDNVIAQAPLLQTAKDSEGNDIEDGDYTVFVLTVADGTNANINALSSGVNVTLATAVSLTAGSEGIAGDQTITGLTIGKKYVISDGTNWKSVIADGTIGSESGGNTDGAMLLALANSVALSGVTAIATTLSNSTTYTVVEVLTAIPDTEYTLGTAEGTENNVELVETNLLKIGKETAGIKVYNAASDTEFKTLFGNLEDTDKFTLSNSGKVSKIEKVATTEKTLTLTTSAGHTALEVVGNSTNNVIIDAVGINVTITSGKAKILKAADVTITAGTVELAPESASDITGAISSAGTTTLTKSLTMGGSKVLTVSDGTFTLDTTSNAVALTLDETALSLVVSGGTFVGTLTNAATVVFGTTASSAANIFYTSAGAVGASEASTTYTWVADADSGSTAGWKAP